MHLDLSLNSARIHSRGSSEKSSEKMSTIASFHVFDDLISVCMRPR